MNSVGSALAARACTACAMPISAPLFVTQELRLMFWDLKGATRYPRSDRRRQSAATRVLLPEWEVVPSTTMKRAMGKARMFKLICLLEDGIGRSSYSWGQLHCSLSSFYGHNRLCEMLK